MTDLAHVDDTTLDDEAVDRFSAQVRGQVIRSSDAAYETARRVLNGMIDQRPAIIVRCAGASDVIAAVTFAATATSS